MAGARYHGDVNPDEAWRILSEDERAALVDVRTKAEWSFVGLPDISATPAPLLKVEWQTYPSSEVNPAFVETLDAELRQAGCGQDAPVLFICRSGARSAAAAAAMTEAGYSHCLNVAGGFEGKQDELHHRGTVDGWKAAQLPWIQT